MKIRVRSHDCREIMLLLTFLMTVNANRVKRINHRIRYIPRPYIDNNIIYAYSPVNTSKQQIHEHTHTCTQCFDYNHPTETILLRRVPEMYKNSIRHYTG